MLRIDELSHEEIEMYLTDIWDYQGEEKNPYLALVKLDKNLEHTDVLKACCVYCERKRMKEIRVTDSPVLHMQMIGRAERIKHTPTPWEIAPHTARYSVADSKERNRLEDFGINC